MSARDKFDVFRRSNFSDELTLKGDSDDESFSESKKVVKVVDTARQIEMELKI